MLHRNMCVHPGASDKLNYLSRLEVWELSWTSNASALLPPSIDGVGIHFPQPIVRHFTCPSPLCSLSWQTLPTAFSRQPFPTSYPGKLSRLFLRSQFQTCSMFCLAHNILIAPWFLKVIDAPRQDQAMNCIHSSYRHCDVRNLLVYFGCR